jgi:hypothetical protein
MDVCVCCVDVYDGPSNSCRWVCVGGWVYDCGGRSMTVLLSVSVSVSVLC